MDAGEAWNQAFQRLKQRNENGKIADAIVKTNPDILNGLGMHPEEFAGLSAQDKSDKIQGVFQAQGYQKAVADVSRLQALGDFQRQEATGLQRRNEGLERFGTAMQGYENTPPMIRRPDRNAVVEENMFRSGVQPEDMQRTSQALENLGTVDQFQPGKTTPFEGTDYVYAPLSRHSGTALPRAGLPRSGTAKPNKFQGAGNEPWIVSDDEEEFKKQFLKIQDPQAQEAILALRRAYRLSNGKGADPLSQLITSMSKGDEKKQEAPGFFSRLFGGGKAAAAAAGAGTPKVRKWNPDTKQFE
jgi:hypothetical protein